MNSQVPGGHLHGRGAGVLCISQMMFVHYNSKHTKARLEEKAAKNFKEEIKHLSESVKVCNKNGVC